MLETDAPWAQKSAVHAAMRSIARNLTFAPSVRRRMVALLEPTSGRPFVAVHLRAEANLSSDVPHAKPWGTERERNTTLGYRRRCGDREKSRFAVVTPRVAARGGVSDVLVASDSSAHEAWLAALLRNRTALRVRTLPPSWHCRRSPRDATCVQEALALIGALAQGRALVKSSWSSFSEMIEYMGTFRAVRNGCT